MSQSLLIVGLGNPGEEYTKTRHNVGFHALDVLADSLNVDFSPQKSCRSLVCKAKLSNNINYILAKPLTFMNASGEAVRCLLSWYDILPTHCIVITDNIDLPVAKIRVKKQSSQNSQKNTSGGTHNGIRSIQSHLQALDGGLEYVRTYIGVGSPRSNQGLSKYVLGKWHESEDQEYMSAFNNLAQSLIALTQDIASKNFDNIQASLAARIASNNQKDI